MNDNSTCGVCHRVFITESDFLTSTSRWRVCASGHLWFNCSCGSTLLVKKGKFDWYSPEKIMSPEARGVFNSLGNLKELPHISSTVMEIQQLIEDPNVNPKTLASRIKTEPVLATQILKIAENIRKSRNPRNPPITSLDHAIVYIGYKAFSDLVVAASLHTFKLPPSQFKVDDYWEEGLLTGVIAEYIATKYKIPVPQDQLFLAGTLCNVGKLVTAVCFPPLIDKIIRDMNSPQTLSTWKSAENIYKFPDHSILGEIAAALWGFPDFVLQTARKHHDRFVSKGRSLHIYEVVAISNQMMHWIRLQPHRMEQNILNDFCTRFELTEKNLDSLALEISNMIKNHPPQI